MSRILGSLLRGTLFVLRPLVHIRLGLIPYRSVGRLAGNMEYYLRKLSRDGKPGREIHIMVTGKAPVNTQIDRMLRRRLPLVIESDRLWKWLRGLQGTPPAQPGRNLKIPDHPMWLDLAHAGYLVEWDTWQEVGPQLGFTDEEHAKGRALLNSLGIPKGAEFVCIHARDKTYTDSPDYTRRSDDRWSADDFRDCDINTYILAAEYLTQHGIWVVRVGHRPDQALSGTNPMIIDYAARVRDDLDDPDFADVYLQANCKFCIPCTAGLYYLSHIFNVPLASVQLAPLAEAGRLDHDLFILKKYRNRHDGRFMTWCEMTARGADWNRLWHEQLDALDREGIEFVDNTPEEILELSQEMVARLSGTWRSEPDDADLEQRFRDAFPTGHPMRCYPGHLGAAFLRNNRELLN